MLKDLNVDVVVNVQGDEPFVDKSLNKLIDVFTNDKNKTIDLASLMEKINDEKTLNKYCKSNCRF